MKVVASVRKSKQRWNKTQSQYQPSHSRSLTVTFDKGGKKGVKRNENQNAKEEKNKDIHTLSALAAEDYLIVRN